MFFQNQPSIVSHASIVGPEESKGPYSNDFDLKCSDPKCGKDSWEKGEMQMVSDVVELAMNKISILPSDINLMFGGDLLNQLITTNFVARDYGIPFLGIYGACSTLVEGLIMGSAMMDGGFADCILTFTSSHYQTAERQYRNPLEYGSQYPSYKQYTVTGAGAYILGWINGQVKITGGTVGKVIDLGVKDANDMGSAMAPAAADTIIQHLKDANKSCQDYDLILTGDLGQTGRKILNNLLLEKNLKTKNKLMDCGQEIFGGKKKYGSGGSGAAASAVFMGSVIIPKIIKGKLKRVLFVGTGALLSPLTVKQKETIPCIAHAVMIERINGG